MNDIEIWKDIPGYEGLYMASDFGRVKSLVNRGGKNARIMEIAIGIKGDNYKWSRIRLTNHVGKRNSCSIHRLIASAFLGFDLKTPMKEAVIMHLNNDATDNRLENLKIGTQSENTRQCITEGRGKQFEMKGSKHNMAKLNEEQVLEIRKLSEEGMKNIVLANIYGVSRTNICDILKRRIWTHI